MLSLSFIISSFFKFSVKSKSISTDSLGKLNTAVLIAVPPFNANSLFNFYDENIDWIEINFSNTKTNKLFFTEYGLGYKCNCTKTACDKYYCQCFNQGRYCHGCNCQNCNNKMPEYISSNKRPKEKEKNEKEEKISCTCTKSGCNKNYCECYKNKTRCHSLCRCRNCENIQKNETQKNIDKNECYKANSIYIMNKRKLFSRKL